MKRTMPKRFKSLPLATIRTLKCTRCGKQAESQWRCCADIDRVFLLCNTCDVAMNKAMLNWLRHPRAKMLMSAYKSAV